MGNYKKWWCIREYGSLLLFNDDGQCKSRIPFEGVICQEIQRICDSWMIISWNVAGKDDGTIFAYLRVSMQLEGEATARG